MAASVADFPAVGKEILMATETFVGIDVGKDWLDVVVIPAGEHRWVMNTEAEWRSVVPWLREGDVQVVVLEASGGYEAGVVGALRRAELPVWVGNPLQLRRFAQSLGKWGKTDRIDAAMLALYGQRMRPTPQPITGDQERTNAALVTRRRQLTQMRAEEQTRLQQPGLPQAVLEQLTAHITVLNAQIKELDRLLADAVAADAQRQWRFSLLTTTPGIAALTGTRLIVGLPELGLVSAKAVSALAGVAPYPRDSGQMHGQRTIGGGRRWVRHALYEAVMTTIRCDPTFAAFYARLREAGKPHKVAMVACMRRLLGILTAMLRDGLTWQQTKVGQGHFLPAAT